MNRRFWLKSAAFAATILGVAGAAGCFTLRGRTGADITQASGRRLERMLASPHFKDGFFHNLEPVTVMTRKRSSWLSMAAFFLEDDTSQKPDKALPVIHDDYHHLPEGSMVWFGHSSFLLRKDGLTIAIDPVFHDASPVPGFFKPFPGPDTFTDDALPEIDVLVITHDHYDHLDYQTAKAIRNRVKAVICPLAVGMHLEAWGYDPKIITELDWDESVTVGGRCKVTCLPSQHFSGRTFERNTTLWAGFVFEFSDFTLYLSGDGGYGKHFRRVGERFKVDLAIVEDGQYNEDWSGIHLMPQAWQQAVIDIAPKVVMGSHHAKFDLSRHLWTDPLYEAYFRAKEIGIPHLTPLIGEVVSLDDVRAQKVNAKQWWL